MLFEIAKPSAAGVRRWAAGQGCAQLTAPVASWGLSPSQSTGLSLPLMENFQVML